MSDPLKPWIDSNGFIIASRLASIAAAVIGAMGAAIAGVAVWIFLRAADNLDALSVGMAGLMTKVAVHDEKIGALAAEQAAIRKRVDGISARVFEVSR